MKKQSELERKLKDIEIKIEHWRGVYLNTQIEDHKQEAKKLYNYYINKYCEISKSSYKERRNNGN